MKKRLYIDMDGVLADFIKAVQLLAPHQEITPGENNDWVYDVCIENPNIFLDLEPLPGAINAVNILMQYYDVYFLSVPMWVVPQSFTDKRLWIERHFGENGKDRLILTSRKDFNTGDFLIDDRLKHGVDKFDGKHIHFGQPEFPSWHEVLEFLVYEQIHVNNAQRLHNS